MLKQPDLLNLISCAPIKIHYEIVPFQILNLGTEAQTQYSGVEIIKIHCLLIILLFLVKQHYQ